MIPLFIVLALVAVAIVGGAILAIVLSQIKPEAPTPAPTSLPTATRPFPTVRAATATVPPTVTETPLPTGTATFTPTPTKTPTSTPTPTPTPRVIITEIKSLGRLETVTFMMQTVIDLEREPANIWEQVFGTDELLLVASGEVVAGFDLSRIREQDITVRGDHVTMVLPPPEILYSRVDNEETYVYERNTGLFRKPDPRIESEARQLAEQAMLERAQQGDILRQAEANGRLQVEALLRSLGFTEILLVVRTE
jgi:hypothetical protein